MKERPILFSAPMVRAILRGEKTQTRRIVKPQPPQLCRYEINGAHSHALCFGPPMTPGGSITCVPPTGRSTDHRLPCPYGAPGDRLWVRETHAQFMVGEGLDRDVPQCVAYRATCDEDGGFDYVNGLGEVMRIRVTKWTPGIHMPRFASRLLLEVTGVRVQRLLDIDEGDAIAEGISRTCEHGCSRLCGCASCIEGGCKTARHAFADLWRSINGVESWDANPWVWAISFRRLR